jgi:uncharacterized membrane protein
MKALQRYLVAGLLIWIPIGVTFIILRLVVNLMDETLFLIPAPYRPEALLGFRIPGLGILLTAVVVFVTGMLAANLVGRRLLTVWDSALQRIPLVRTIYGSVQKFSEVVFAEREKTFTKVLLVEYPRKGVYRMGFQTAVVADFGRRVGREVISVYVPNSPNVAAGFLVMVPREEVIELDLDVESAVKMIVSMGVVVPPHRAAAVAPAPPPP